MAEKIHLMRSGVLVALLLGILLIEQTLAQGLGPHSMREGNPPVVVDPDKPQTQTTRPAMVWVDDDWAACHQGECLSPGLLYGFTAFATVQEAVDAVRAAGQVIVHPGTYKEWIIVERTMTITGDDKETTVIDGMQSGPALTLGAPGVWLTGFTVHNCGTSPVPEDGIYTQFGDHTIKGNKFTSNATCIHLDGADKVTIEGNHMLGNGGGCLLIGSSENTIKENTFQGNAGGIFLYDDSDFNLVTGNSFEGEVGAVGMRVTHFNTVSDNTFYFNFAAIDVETSSDAVIEGNTIEFTQVGGIGISTLNGGARNTISNNTLSTQLMSVPFGLWLPSLQDSEVSGNTIGPGYQTGIYCGIGMGNEVSGNTIIGNGMGLYVDLYCMEGGTIYHNNFINNGQHAHDQGLTASWDDGYPSGGNYWDDYTGPDGDSDGIGDVPYEIPSFGHQDNYPLMSPWP